MNKSYNLYISEIKDNILSPEEELRLIKVYQEKQTGWEEAQDRIIKSNLMFVVKVAFEFTNDPNKISDLISEGNIALLNALNRFKSDKGAKLISYANYEIRGKMARLFINETRLSYLNIPERTRIKLGKISKFIDEFKMIHQKPPSIQRIANEFNLKDYTVAIYLETLGFINVCLDDTLKNNADQFVASIIEDETSPSPDDELNFKQTSSIIKKIIDSLPEREKYIMNKRFGFDGDDPQDLASIGRDLNLTRERIRQIESSTMKIIRKEIEKLKIS